MNTKILHIYLRSKEMPQTILKSFEHETTNDESQQHHVWEQSGEVKNLEMTEKNNIMCWSILSDCSMIIQFILILQSVRVIQDREWQLLR